MFSSNPPSGAPSLAPLPSSLAETVSRLELPSARGSGGSETTSTSPRAPPARNARGRQGASESRNTPVHTPPCAEGWEGPGPARGEGRPRTGATRRAPSGGTRGRRRARPPWGPRRGGGRDSDHSPSPSMAAGGAGARSGRPGLWRAHRTAAFPRAIFRPAGGFINRESAGGPASRTTKSSGRFWRIRDFRERSRPAPGALLAPLGSRAFAPKADVRGRARFFARAGGFPRAALGGTPARAALAATPPREPRAAPRARGAMRLREHVRALAAGLETPAGVR